MPAHGDSWYPELPDRTCPVCQAQVKFEAGYYDKKPLYRCQECSYVIKQTSEVSLIALMCLGLVGLSVLCYFVGQAIVGVTPRVNAYAPPSFFTPAPSPPSTYGPSVNP